MPIAPLRDAPTWRRLLAEHGLTYAWLAARTGVSPATVQAYATGQRTAKAEWIERAESVIAREAVTP